jgi:hypothetical protein
MIVEVSDAWVRQRTFAPPEPVTMSVWATGVTVGVAGVTVVVGFGVDVAVGVGVGNVWLTRR